MPWKRYKMSSSATLVVNQSHPIVIPGLKCAVLADHVYRAWAWLIITTSADTVGVTVGLGAPECKEYIGLAEIPTGGAFGPGYILTYTLHDPFWVGRSDALHGGGPALLMLRGVFEPAVDGELQIGVGVESAALPTGTASVLGDSML